MGKFRITLTDQAKKDFTKHYKSSNQATIKKIEKKTKINIYFNSLILNVGLLV
jgi:hypothetical protein